MADTHDPVARPGGVPQGAPPPRSGGGSGLRIGGWILAAVGGLLLAAGIALVVVHLTQRNSDGYYTSSTVRVAAPGYAVTSEALDIGDFPSGASDLVDRVRVSATSSTGQALFIGIAPQNAVNGYLAGVARSEVTEFSGDSVSYRTHTGRAPGTTPARQGFWESSASGSGQVTTVWKVKGGTWSIVLMNANGAPRVNAAVILGAKTDLVLWVGLGLILVGLIAGGAGGAMVWSSRPRRATGPPPALSA